jgi:hypothetical protein
MILRADLRSALLAAAAALTLLSAPARADIVLFGAGDVLGSFVDVGASGFGNVNRALTLQNSGIEFGAHLFGNVLQDEAIGGADKGGTPTIGSLGWTSGFNVGIGFNSNQTGGTGITLDAMRLTVWNATGGLVFTAGLGTSPIDFSAAILALQQGNGNAIFDFELNAAERAQFNTMLTLAGSSNFTVGLSAILGCGTIGPGTFDSPGCMATNDGADSFVLFNQTLAVPGPIMGTGIPSMIAGALALWGLNWRRRRLAA